MGREEVGEELPPALPHPLSLAPHRCPWRDFIIGSWLAPSFQLINTVMGGAQVCSGLCPVYRLQTWVTALNPFHGPVVGVPLFTDE